MKPNTFIAGAPKCGTTSLAHWLSLHPSVFFSGIKEPHYFNFDMGNRTVMSRDAYCDLFRQADPQRYKVISEASTWYMYSKVAVPEILKFQPDARFIAMVRDPAEMALSLYRFLRLRGYETAGSFEEAWALQEERAAGRAIPAACPEPGFLAYRKACSLGEQVRRLVATAGAERVHLVSLEDMTAEPDRIYRSVLEYLKLSDMSLPSYDHLNPAREVRSPWMGAAVNLVKRAKTRMGIHAGFGLRRLVERKARPASEDDRAFMLEISVVFDEDRQYLNSLQS